MTLVENPVWDLSAARANRMRLLLEEAGLSRTRMRRLTGHADRSPATKDPMSPRNNRLEVTCFARAENTKFEGLAPC